MNTLFLHKEIDMGLPQQRIEQIQEYLLTKADDRFINLIYGLIQAEKENESYELSEEHKKILDQRLEAHRLNPTEGRSWEEVKASLRNKL